MSSPQNDEKHTLPQAEEPLSSRAAAPNEAQPHPVRRSALRRVFRWLGRGVVGIVGFTLITAGGSYVFLRTDSGERWLTSVINSSLQSLPSGLSASIAAFHGPLLSEAHIEGLVLRDSRGEWFTAKNVALRIDWSALPEAFVVAELSADAPELLRIPVLEPSAEPEPEPTAPAITPQEGLDRLSAFLKEWPSWLPALRIDSLAMRSAAVRQEVTPLPFVASLAASASASKEGLKAAMEVHRDDGSLPVEAFNRRAALKAALSPELRFMLDATLSDLGFASAFVPPSLAKVPAFGISLKGDAPVADWKTSLNGQFRDIAVTGDKASELLSLSGSVTVQALSEKPAATMTLETASGALASRLWTVAGQKDGRFILNADAKASAGDTVTASANVKLSLASMQWASKELDVLLGKDVSAQTSATVRLGKDGRMEAHLQKLDAKAAHLLAEAAGSVAMDGRGFSHPDSRADVDARFRLLDAAELSPELSGDVDVQAHVSGTFSALAAELELHGSRLSLPRMELKDMDMKLALPSVNVAGLALGVSSSSKISAPLLSGTARASLLANDQPLRLQSDWQMDSARGLRLMLDRLELSAGENSVVGRLNALLPSSAPAPAKDSVAAMLGTPLPALSGDVSVEVRNWETLSALSGVALSGSPLSASLSLAHEGRQAFSLKSDMPSLQLSVDGRQIALSKATLTASGADLWGRPVVELNTSLDSLAVDKASVGPISLVAQGGLDSAHVEAQSSGALVADIAADWKPGRVFLEKLAISADPKHFGLPESSTVGMHLEAPAEFTYSGTSAKLPALKAVLLPSGSLDVSGSYSPKAMKGHVLLEVLDLKHLRPFAPAIDGGEAALQAEVSGIPHAPTGNFKFNLKDVTIHGASLPPVDLTINGDLAMRGKRRMLRADMEMSEKTQMALGLTRFELGADVPFTSPASGGVSQPDLNAPLSAVFSLAGQLEGLWKLVPSADMRLSGLADVDARVEGSASAPVVTAHALIEKGRFFDLANGVGLRDIKLKLDAKKLDIMHKKAADRVTLDLSAKAGSKGTLELGGWLDPATMALDISGAMRSLAPLRRQDAKVMLSGTLGVQGTVTSPIVKADITVDKGEIQLAHLPGSSIPTLEIWTPESEKPKEEAPAVPGRLDVSVTIPNQFFVRGYGLDCEWGGQLSINAPLDRPAVSGELKAVRGTLDILGKNFKLASGQVRFNGGWPVMPLIDIDMEYAASSLTANILVSGTASKPKLTLTSQPVYPQDEILSRIMFGQSSSSLSHVQALQLASGAASLAGFGGPGVMDLGRKLLGVDVFKINSDNDGEDSDVSNTSLEMGTYVRDNIYVGFEQGIGKNSEAGAVVEIELRPGLEAQAKASGSDTEVGLEWKKNY